MCLHLLHINNKQKANPSINWIIFIPTANIELREMIALGVFMLNQKGGNYNFKLLVLTFPVLVKYTLFLFVIGLLSASILAYSFSCVYINVF